MSIELKTFDLGTRFDTYIDPTGTNPSSEKHRFHVVRGFKTVDFVSFELRTSDLGTRLDTDIDPTPSTEKRRFRVVWVPKTSISCRLSLGRSI